MVSDSGTAAELDELERHMRREPSKWWHLKVDALAALRRERDEARERLASVDAFDSDLAEAREQIAALRRERDEWRQACLGHGDKAHDLERLIAKKDAALRQVVDAAKHGSDHYAGAVGLKIYREIKLIVDAALATHPETTDAGAKRDRPAKDPGGMECEECGQIFVGEPWHDKCAVCAAPAPAISGGIDLHEQGYRAGWCDALKAIADEAAAPAISGGEITLPKERVCMPDPMNKGARIIGFRIREGDQAWGELGVSEPLFWLERALAAAGQKP